MKLFIAAAVAIKVTGYRDEDECPYCDVFGPNGKNYQNNDPGQDSAKIGIDIDVAGSGDNCKAGDWTSVHWTAALNSGRVVSDSRVEGTGSPKVIALGK